MIADFFTKPLQGNLFKRLSAVIMGKVDLLTLKKENTKQESKECITSKIQGQKECVKLVGNSDDAPQNCDARNGDVPRMLDNNLNHSKSLNITYTDVLKNISG